MNASWGAEMQYFEYQGHRLAYTDLGSSDRPPFILIHGQLLSQFMHQPLARELADAGHRVITIDLLGHGASDRPTEMWRYSMTRFAEQVLGLMDHLGLDRAVVGGTSLGANVSLEFGVLAPDRAAALVVEMPVLDAGVYGAVVAFTPLLSALLYARPVVRALGFAARLVPRWALPFLGNVLLDTMRQDHVSSPAVLQGLFLGRIAPAPDLRAQLPMPVLVIGHHHDPIHPYADAAMLARELPQGHLVEATSILELRLHPERLTEEIGQFLDRVPAQPARRPRPPRRVAAASPPRASTRTKPGPARQPRATTRTASAQRR